MTGFSKSKLNSPGGGYEPSFYLVSIDSTDDMAAILSSDRARTVIHEYIHFLQDICTTSGLMRSTICYNNIARLYRIKEQDIVLPIRDISQYRSFRCVRLNNQLNSVYNNMDYGNLCEKRIAQIEFDNVYVGKETHALTKRIHVDTYFIHLIKGKRVIYNLPFGAHCIYEGMADLFERFLFPAKERAVLIPYDLPRIVIRYCCPQLDDPKLVFALCSVALMSYDPAKLFLDIISLIKQKRIIVKSPKDIFIIAKKGFNYNGATYYELFNKTKIEAISAINSIFNIRNIEKHPEYCEPRDWLLSWLSKYSTPDFFCDFMCPLFENDPVTARRDLVQFFNSVLSPIIVNKDNHCFALGKDDEVGDPGSLFLWAFFKEMYDFVFHEEEKGCTLSTYCFDANVDNFDIDCLNSPLQKKISESGLCVLNQLFRQWGLYKHNIRKKDDYFNKSGKSLHS